MVLIASALDSLSENFICLPTHILLHDVIRPLWIGCRRREAKRTVEAALVYSKDLQEGIRA